MEHNLNLSEEIIRMLPKAALAHKYNCSVQYVRKVLQNQKNGNTERVRGIRRDAGDISRILLRGTSFSQTFALKERTLSQTGE